MPRPESSNWRDALTEIVCPSCGHSDLPKQQPLVERDKTGVIYCASCGVLSPPKEPK